jgi:hypothetical protein
MNVEFAANVGSAKESLGLPVSENTPPVIGEPLVFTNANSRPSLATAGPEPVASAESMAEFPVF